MRKIVAFCVIILSACNGSSRDQPREETEDIDPFTPLFLDSGLTELELSALILSLDSTPHEFVTLFELSPIMDDLLLIRAHEPNTQLISANSNFINGLLIQANSDFSSEEKPWESLPSELQPIRFSELSSANTYHLEVPINLNPNFVLESYTQLNSIESVEFNSIIGNNNDICREEDANNTYYIFWQGMDDCSSGCINQRYYGFSIDEFRQIQVLGTHDITIGQNIPEPNWLTERLECRISLKI